MTARGCAGETSNGVQSLMMRNQMPYYSPPTGISTVASQPVFEMIPHRVFVCGFIHETTENELRQLFEQFYHIREVKVIRDSNNVSKGYGFITFDTEEEAEAVRLMSPERLELNGRRLNLGPALRRISYSTEYEMPTSQGYLSPTSYVPCTYNEMSQPAPYVMVSPTNVPPPLLSQQPMQQTFPLTPENTIHSPNTIPVSMYSPISLYSPSHVYYDATTVPPQVARAGFAYSPMSMQSPPPPARDGYSSPMASPYYALPDGHFQPYQMSGYYGMDAQGYIPATSTHHYAAYSNPPNHRAAFQQELPYQQQSWHQNPKSEQSRPKHAASEHAVHLNSPARRPFGGGDGRHPSQALELKSSRNPRNGVGMSAAAKSFPFGIKASSPGSSCVPLLGSPGGNCSDAARLDGSLNAESTPDPSSAERPSEVSYPPITPAPVPKVTMKLLDMSINDQSIMGNQGKKKARTAKKGEN